MYEDHCFRHCHALRFILSHKQFKQFEVTGLPNVNDCYFLRMIAPALQGSMQSYYLRLSSPDVGDEGARIVAKIIKGAVTTNLFVHFREITE